jgi:hypothetical protein
VTSPRLPLFRTSLSFLLTAALAGASGCVLDDSPFGGDEPDDTADPGDSDDGDMIADDGGDDGGKEDDADDGDGADDSADDGEPDDGETDGDGDEIDAAVPDAGPPDIGPPPTAPFQLLSESGLYSDIVNHVVAADRIEFEPEFKLWSDGAAKRRWIYLPPDTQIDTEQMDGWLPPEGTTVWKEFSDPDTGKRLETRIIQRLPNGNFYFASFIWNEDDTEAVFDPTPGAQPPVDIPDGCAECADPPCEQYPPDCHVVPQRSECIDCHGGEDGRLLGVSAVQLSHDGPGLTLTDLVEQNRLTDPPAGGETFPVPGTPVERNAIGYLHANCGHCHSPEQGFNICYAGTGLEARVLPGDNTVEQTAIYQSAVDQPLTFWLGEMRGNFTDITERIVSGNPSQSAVWYRMSVREFGEVPPFNDHQQMPYFATNEVDEEGLAAVELWINSLP